MRGSSTAIAGLLILTACRTPGSRPAPPGELPLRINVRLHQAFPNREGAESRLAEALRDRLAGRARVLSAGADARADEAQLEVHVMAAPEREDLVRDNARNAFMAPVKAMADVRLQPGNDPWGYVFFVALGVVAGAVAGPVAAVGTEARGLYHEARLGYQPRHLICRVDYREGPDSGTRELFSLGAWEVVKAMKPLAEGEDKTAEALQREEAAALARVVGDRLAVDFRWVPVSTSRGKD